MLSNYCLILPISAEVTHYSVEWHAIHHYLLLYLMKQEVPMAPTDMFDCDYQTTTIGRNRIIHACYNCYINIVYVTVAYDDNFMAFNEIFYGF